MLTALHNYEMAAEDTLGDFSYDLAKSVDRADIVPKSEAKVLTEAVRTFANHSLALGRILEGRSFPPQFDLSGVKISVPLSRVYMPEGNFEACTVCPGGSFAHAIMPGCNFCSSSFTGVHFTSAVLCKSLMRNCRFTNCDFTRCNLSGADFQDSVFFQCTFDGCNFKDAFGNKQTSFVYPYGKESFRSRIRGDPKIIFAPPAAE